MSQIPKGENPNWRQITDAKLGSSSPPHTVPHTPFIQTRTTPALSTGAAETSCTSPSLQAAAQENMYIWWMSIMSKHIITYATQGYIIEMIAPWAWYWV